MNASDRCFSMIATFALLLSVSSVLPAGSAAGADQFQPDPVEALKQILTPPRDVVPVDRKEVAAELGKVTEKIASVSDLLRALALPEWPQPEARDPLDEAKLESQALLAERLEQKIRQLLRSGSTSSQLATLTLIAEMGSRISVPESLSLRNLNKLSEGLTGVSPRSSTSRKALGRVLTADVVYLVHHGENERVREAAARTLGQIFPEPAEAASALRSLLGSARAGERRAAATGLLGLVQLASRFVASTGTMGTEVRIDFSPADWVETCTQVIPAASAGLADQDVEVRRSCALALERSTAGLLDQAAPQQRIGPEPERERRTTPVRARSNELLPVLEAFGNRGTAAALSQATLDSDAEVRILSRRALEEIGSVRDRLLHPEPGAPPLSLPGPEQASQQDRPAPDTLLASASGQVRQRQGDSAQEALRLALPALRMGVFDPVVAARLQAVQALESMGPLAGSAVPELTRALDDPDRFVRWAAARALGKIGPDRAATAVAALGRLLGDWDLDVDLAAATALERFGPVARDAVPQLVRALGASDAEKRLAVIRTLTAIGTDARPAIPALAVALSDPDETVRRNAAQLLGKFGTQAASAEPALRSAMADPVPEVRQAASGALLKILQSTEPR
jgi:HEAT repeat protein